MKTCYSFSLIFSFILFFACSKEVPMNPEMGEEEMEEEEMEEEEMEEIVKIYEHDVFLVGDSIPNVIVVNYDPHLRNTSINGQEHYGSLDLDNDGENDISIGAVDNFSSGGMRERYTGIASKHIQIEIAYIDFIDTTKICFVTENDTLIRMPRYNQNSSFICDSIYKDSILSISNYKVAKNFNQRDTLGIEFNWTSEYLILGYHDSSNNGDISATPFINDIKRGDFMGDGDNYLQFRFKEENGDYRYGWLSFSINNAWWSVSTISYAYEE